ncbi:MAG TPA: RHS repeat-associated core domain-containing protein, partial [Bryobacteraceae bacterium]|nr:RHS repeat-associated core domain-containing protein [Bryobacteraceae bacterium]
EQRYQLANHLGSASLEIDEAGGLITYEEYSPYGETTYQAGISAAEVRRKRYRYTSKERDWENGFTYHGARYYAPWLGRWTACDPAGMIDGPNLFRFARNNPVVYRDPEGTDPPKPEPSIQDPPDLPPPSDDNPPPDPLQAQAQNTGFSNSALVQPKGVQTSEFTFLGVGGGGSPGTSGAGSLLYHYRNVVSRGVELGLQGGFGGSGASGSPAVGTGILAGTLHLGPEFDQFRLDATRQNIFGLYLGLGFLWGQNPMITDMFTREPEQVGGANPSVSALGVYSLIKSEVQGRTTPHLHQKLEFDANVGGAYQRFGSINGVSVLSLAQVTAVINVAINDFPADNWQTNVELGATGNFGLGGIVRDPTSTTPITGSGVRGTPFSLTETLGIGFSRAWGDYAIGFEPYLQHESFPNVATQGATGSFAAGAWSGGLKFDITAINPPKTHRRSE